MRNNGSMINGIKYLMVIALCYITTFVSLGQDYGDRYRTVNDYFINTKLLKNQLGLQLYVELEIVNKKRPINDFAFAIYQTTGYEDNQQFRINKDSLYIGRKNNSHFFKFTINPEVFSPLLILEVTSLTEGKQHYFDLPLYTEVPILLSNNQLPQTKPFADSTYFITDVNPCHIYYYDFDFPPGLPPMVTKEQIQGKSLEIAAKSNVIDTAKLYQTGFYLFQNDTTSIKSTSVLIKDKYYPKFTTIDQLVDPLIYITSKNEIESLLAINGDKKLFDKFWLNLTQSADRAKSIIRVYYDRVEQANKLFTSFKEGWKTDMGMIYTVMGPPDLVEKSMNEESWVYLGTRNLPRRKYTFIRSETVFSPNYYVLIREKKHAEAWFESIDLLRKGIFK